MRTLAERFVLNEGQPLEVEGVLVHSIFRRAVSHGEVVRVRFVHKTQTPPQGIRFKVEGGSVEVRGQRLEDVVCWAETAPDEFEIRCSTGEAEQAQFLAWNCWRDENGTTHAWLGDAGFTAEQDGQKAVLRCSDGTPGFDPTDLVLELVFMATPSATRVHRPSDDPLGR